MGLAGAPTILVNIAQFDGVARLRAIEAAPLGERHPIGQAQGVKDSRRH